MPSQFSTHFEGKFFVFRTPHLPPPIEPRAQPLCPLYHFFFFVASVLGSFQGFFTFCPWTFSSLLPIAGRPRCLFHSPWRVIARACEACHSFPFIRLFLPYDCCLTERYPISRVTGVFGFFLVCPTHQWLASLFFVAPYCF